MGVLSICALLASAKPLVFSEREVPRTLSGLYTDSPAEVRAAALVYDALFYRTAISSEAKSRLVERWEWVGTENRTLRLVLHDNLVWHDGEQLDAQDVCFTMAAHLNPANELVRHEYFRWAVEGCEVSDEGTADLRMRQRVPHALDLVGFPVLPEHRFESSTVGRGHAEWRKPIGSGPFRPESRLGGKTIELVAAPSSHHRPRLKSLRMVERPDVAGAVQAVLDGELDGVVEVPPASRSKVERSSVAYAKNYELRTWWYVAFDTSHPLLGKREVRAAFHASVDRERLQRQVVAVDPKDPNPPCELVSGPFLTSSTYANRSVPVGRVSEPKVPLEGTESITLRLGYDASTERDAPGLAENLVRQWSRALSLRFDIEAVPHEEWEALRESGGFRGRFDLVVDQWWERSFEDVTPLLQSKGAFSPFGWSDLETDALLNAWRGAATVAEAEEAMHALHERAAKELPMVFLWELDTKSVWRNDVRNSIIAPRDYFTDVEAWQRL